MVLPPKRCPAFAWKVGFDPQEQYVHFVNTVRNQKAEWTITAFLHQIKGTTWDAPMYPAWLVVGGLVARCLVHLIRLKGKGAKPWYHSR